MIWLRVIRHYISIVLFGNDFIVHEGQFVIFYPEDGHKACISVDEPCLVKKIVLKVSVA
jgi:biofilm protein TabA